jgi:phosphonate transport system substrate-binding protein
MTLNLTISPDFSPEKLAGWHIFNTWLQRKLSVDCHLELYNSFAAQRQAIAEDKVDLIYANPSDAAMLVREKGFVAVAHPQALPDEAVVAVAASSAHQKVEDLKPGIKVVSSGDPDVSMMGMILLEPADLNAGNVTTETCATYVLVAKQLMGGTADVGIFPARAYDGLSSMVRNSLRPLVRSEISVIRHMLLAGPKAAPLVPNLQAAMVGMAGDEKEAAILKDLGFPGWEASSQEDVEFMIDLMDTLIG